MTPSAARIAEVPPAPLQSKVYLTFPEACEYSRINRNKMRDLLKAGKIPSRKVGRTWIVPRASIDAFMAEPRNRVRLAVRNLVG